MLIVSLSLNSNNRNRERNSCPFMLLNMYVKRAADLKENLAFKKYFFFLVNPNPVAGAVK